MEKDMKVKITLDAATEKTITKLSMNILPDSSLLHTDM